jgi:hypothetical protein
MGFLYELKIRTMDMRNSFFVLFVIVLEKFSGKKWGQLQRKAGKFGQTSKIIIFVCTLDHNRR